MPVVVSFFFIVVPKCQRMFSRCCALFKFESSVIGAPLVSLEEFPLGASGAIRLYRRFLRLVYRHPPAERPDLLFKLRNEFRSRNGKNFNYVRRALSYGSMKLNHYEGLFGARTIREAGLATSSATSERGSDVLWEQFQSDINGVLPGLANSPKSKARRFKYGTYRQSMVQHAHGAMAARHAPHK